MAEPSSTTAIAVSAATGVGLATIPGVDVGAIVGGFAGALFFVVFANDRSFKASLGYLVSSWIFGYFMAAQSSARGVPVIPPLVALGSAAVFVIAATGALEWLKGGKAPFWFRFIPWLGGKKDG